MLLLLFAEDVTCVRAFIFPNITIAQDLPPAPSPLSPGKPRGRPLLSRCPGRTGPIL